MIRLARRTPLVTALVVGTGVLSATAAKRDRVPAAGEIAPQAPPEDRDPSRPPWDSLTASIVAGDPFRAERRASPVPYVPGGAAVEQEVVTPPSPRPTFVLRGIVHAAAPRAVIEGFPDTSGAIAVRVGQVIGAFRIEEIAMNRVIINGADTTWTLKVEVPW